MGFTFIDLFCGIGGFRLAMESVGGRCVFSSDISRNARATYQANYGETPAGNIRKIRAEDIPAFHVLCAGFPCQAFSLAGKQRGFDDERGQMIFEVARIAGYHRPEVIFLENVPNLLKHDNGRTFRVIRDLLEALGYRVYHKLLAACDYGAATIRTRVYIVCIRSDLDAAFSFPEPQPNTHTVADFLEKEVGEEYFLDPATVTYYKKDITEKIYDYTYRIGYIDHPGQGRRVFSVNGCTPAFVVTSRGPAGGTEAYLVDGRPRRLTPSEAARIMGFPEGFRFPVPASAALEQIGNSVAVPVLKAIARQIIAAGILDGKDVRDGEGPASGPPDGRAKK